MEVEGGRLLLSLSGDAGRELVPTGDDTFADAVRGSSMRFRRGDDGRVQTLLVAGREAKRVN